MKCNAWHRISERFQKESAINNLVNVKDNHLPKNNKIKFGLNKVRKTGEKVGGL